MQFTQPYFYQRGTIFKLKKIILYMFYHFMYEKNYFAYLNQPYLMPWIKQRSLVLKH